MTESAIPHTRRRPMTPTYVFTHTKMRNPTKPVRVAPPRPKECHRDTPLPARLLPEVDYPLRPRPLPISGAFGTERMSAMIQSLPNAQHRELFDLRYARGYHLADVARIMAYDGASIWHMHRAAVRELNRQVRQKIDAKPTEARFSARTLLVVGALLGAAFTAMLWWVTETALMTYNL